MSTERLAISLRQAALSHGLEGEMRSSAARGPGAGPSPGSAGASLTVTRLF
ncbi:MAG: hypothetical protein M3N28_01680 [Actinomycetota bacterium]|nr:hypothetical protein [Actinomycetota bacterium]